MRNDVLRFTAQEKAGDVFFTTMIDLYAIQRDFPSLDAAEKLRGDPYRRVAFLEEAWARDIADRRFVPFIQLHEYEAFLFVDPKAFDLFYDAAAKQIANLQAVADAYPSPELIDDSEQTAPSKRIIAQFPDYEGAKATIGPQVGQLIGIQAIRQKCPHFDRWVTMLEQLKHV